MLVLAVLVPLVVGVFGCRLVVLVVVGGFGSWYFFCCRWFLLFIVGDFDSCLLEVLFVLGASF